MHEHGTLLDLYSRLWSSTEWISRPALHDASGAIVISYGELLERVANIAGRLNNAGIVRRQFLAVAMERSLDSVIAMLGILSAGACPCPLEPGLTRDEILGRTHSVGIDTVLADAINRSRFDAMPAVRALDAETLEDAPAYWCEGSKDEDPGLLLFTSGSTGRPKGVLISHKGLLNNALGVIPATKLKPSDKLLHVTPLYHTNGVNNQLFSPLLAGAQVVLCDRFQAQAMPQLMHLHRPTIITGVPTMYSRMLNLEFSPESLAALRFARCGSAPITRELHMRVEQLLERPLIVSYGLSEATCTSTINPPDDRRIGSIGRSLPMQKVFLRHSDGSEITQSGVDGEICIEGGSLMIGYIGTEKDGVLEPAPATLRSGDLGRIDEDGYFYITGRLKDVIIRGGENISPATIEQVISASPDVKSCCVIGRPHLDLGEVPVAFVVSVDPAREDKTTIQRLVSDTLSKIYWLDDVIFMDNLPENSIGKIDRKKLMKSLAETANSATVHP